MALGHGRLPFGVGEFVTDLWHCPGTVLPVHGILPVGEHFGLGWARPPHQLDGLKDGRRRKPARGRSP